MAHIEERENVRGNTFRVQIRKRGQKGINKTFKTKEEAESFSKSIKDSFDGKLEIPKFTLNIWIERYRQEVSSKRKGSSTYSDNYIDFWDEKLGKELANEITPTMIEFHADNLYNVITRNGKPHSSNSRRKYLICLSMIFKTAIQEWKWGILNPVSMVNKHWNDSDNRHYHPSNKEEVYSEDFKKFRQDFECMIKDRMKNLSQEEAAKKCGLTKSSLQHVITPGNNCYLKNFIAVCKGLGIALNLVQVKE